MNFKLSVFLALVICTLLVTAAPPPNQDAPIAIDKSRFNNMLATCGFSCSMAPQGEKSVKACNDKCKNEVKAKYKPK
ncbi:hypothetical protein O0I10_008137 [Lichtheimia ornata]|uniref:Uncharacterized protein n=1 Tax=Lichtheimia ornata TaxID=688661 RepID=A0AAD7UYT9_9FUNG|nr:uncharacterized protein O0I10_008137 [Lichtheimia ornata]KAJ8656124.1 hypothetical protein O0I10_008137 [Lichtheimia ornata]